MTDSSSFFLFFVFVCIITVIRFMVTAVSVVVFPWRRCMFILVFEVRGTCTSLLLLEEVHAAVISLYLRFLSFPFIFYFFFSLFFVFYFLYFVIQTLLSSTAYYDFFATSLYFFFFLFFLVAFL